MIVKTGALYKSDKAFGVLTSLTLPIALSLILARNRELYATEMQRIIPKYNEVFAKHGDAVETGGYQIGKEKLQAVNEELAPIADVDVDVPFVKFKLSQLSSADVRLSAEDAAALKWLIDEDA